MKTIRTVHGLLLIAGTLFLACFLVSPVAAEQFKKGQKVWSKHFETPLLDEPKPLAAVVVKVGFAEKLSVRAIQGTWLRVKADEGEGWVFQGNVATDKPELAPGAGWTTVEASQTNTVAAARPLSPAAEMYAQSRGATNAQADVNWIDEQAALLTMQDIIVYLEVEQLGEYQQ